MKPTVPRRQNSEVCLLMDKTVGSILGLRLKGNRVIRSRDKNKRQEMSEYSREFLTRRSLGSIGGG